MGGRFYWSHIQPTVSKQKMDALAQMHASQGLRRRQYRFPFKGFMHVLGQVLDQRVVYSYSEN